MKRMLWLALIFFCIFLCLIACAKDKQIAETLKNAVPDKIEQTEQPFVPEIECGDILAFMNGEFLGKSITECNFPEDSLFLTGDNVVGYDYVCIENTQGNITFYLEDGYISSYVFGSVPYSDVNEYKNALEVVNKKIAELLKTNEKEFEFGGGSSKEDEMESLFSGKCIAKAEYSHSSSKITVTGCGINGVATIVVECKAFKTEG